jgi:hypothetical protein
LWGPVLIGYLTGISLIMIAGMRDVDDYPAVTTVPGLVVYRYDARCASRTPRTSGAGALAAVDTGLPGSLPPTAARAQA